MYFRGSYGEARDIYQYLVASRELEFDRDHASNLTACANLAAALAQHGQHNEAQLAYKPAAEVSIVASQHAKTFKAQLTLLVTTIRVNQEYLLRRCENRVSSLPSSNKRLMRFHCCKLTLKYL